MASVILAVTAGNVTLQPVQDKAEDEEDALNVQVIPDLHATASVPREWPRNRPPSALRGGCHLTFFLAHKECWCFCFGPEPDLRHVGIGTYQIDGLTIRDEQVYEGISCSRFGLSTCT